MACSCLIVLSRASNWRCGYIETTVLFRPTGGRSIRSGIIVPNPSNHDHAYSEWREEIIELDGA